MKNSNIDENNMHAVEVDENESDISDKDLDQSTFNNNNMNPEEDSFRRLATNKKI